MVQAEDGAGQQERLRHVVEQSGSHIVDADNLIGYQCDAADNEQHRTGILRDFKASVFHGIVCLSNMVQSYEKNLTYASISQVIFELKFRMSSRYK